MKFKKNIIEIMKDAAVNCDTEEKAEALIKELARYDVEWRGGCDLTDSESEWETFKSETCYTLKGPFSLIFSDCDDFEKDGDKIIKFEDLLENEQEDDIISHPAHYCHSKYEPKDVIRDWGLKFNLGNVVKYISRAGYKDDIVQDLKKARQFISFEIEALEEERNN